MTEPRNLHDVLTAILAEVPDEYRRTQMDAFKPESMHDKAPPWFAEIEEIQTRCRFMPPELGRDEAWWWEAQHSLDEFFLGFDASVAWHGRLAEIWTGASNPARDILVKLYAEVEPGALRHDPDASVLQGQPDGETYAHSLADWKDFEILADVIALAAVLGMSEGDLGMSEGDLGSDKREDSSRPSLPADPELLFLRERTTGAWEVVDAATKSCVPFAVGGHAGCMAWLDLNQERFSAKARGE